MSVAACPSLIDLADDRSHLSARQIWGMVGISLALHLVLALLAATIRFQPAVVRPAATYQVSLVTLPTPPMPTESAQPAPPRPAPAPAKPIESPKPKATPVKPAPVKAVPVPQPSKPSVIVAPRPAPAPVTPAKRPVLNIHDAMKGVELPPNAPALGDLAPAPRAAAKPVQDLRTMLNALNVPETASVSTPPQAEPVRENPAKPVLDPDLLRQLETLQQPIPAAAAKAPVVASKVAPARQVRPVLTQDGGPGSDHYLGRVQREISGKWVPVKIESSGTAMQVTLRFRLSRDGKVTGLAVEESSGNGYYDDSAKRAVLSSSLPPFPHEMPAQYLDVHFSFTVGEQAG